MREIKFRAWDSEFQTYVEPGTYFVEFDGSVWFNNCADGEDHMVDQSSKLTVEQYTGIKDSTGREIYEGDIDKDGLIVTYCGDTQAGLGMNCAWYLQRDDFESWVELKNNNDHKIIGNIHENPEMLKNC